MKTLIKHFRFLSNFPTPSLEEQMNKFLTNESIHPSQIIDLKYDSFKSGGVIGYSALLVYKK